MFFLPVILLFPWFTFATSCSQLCVRTVMLLWPSCCDSAYFFLLLMLFFSPIPVVLIWDVHFSPHQVGAQQFLQRSWSSARPSMRSCMWIEGIPGTNIFSSEAELRLALGRKTWGCLWTKSWTPALCACSSETQLPGLHQRRCGQWVKGRDPVPLPLLQVRSHL